MGKFDQMLYNKEDAQQKQVKYAVLKSSFQKQDTSMVPEGLQQELKSNVCGQFLLSRIGLEKNT